MRTIVAGSRDITDYGEVAQAIRASGFQISLVVSGGAAGVDQLGERWAFEHEIPIERFPADWAAYGRAAGPMRNRLMSEHSDALVAIWDGKSRGTANTIECAKRKGLKVFVWLVGGR